MLKRYICPTILGALISVIIWFAPGVCVEDDEDAKKPWTYVTLEMEPESGIRLYLDSNLQFQTITPTGREED